jgi:hypothetical protein
MIFTEVSGMGENGCIVILGPASQSSSKLYAAELFPSVPFHCNRHRTWM